MFMEPLLLLEPFMRLVCMQLFAIISFLLCATSNEGKSAFFFVSPDTENEDRPQRNLYAKFIKGRIWE